MKPPKTWIIIGGCLGFLAVALGAFGAHGLKDSLTPELMEIYKTGVLYHLVHSVVILAIGLGGNEKYYGSAAFFSAGIVLFSFSLYAYAITSITALAIITPLGGMSFLAGWLLLVIQAVRPAKS